MEIQSEIINFLNFEDEANEFGYIMEFDEK